MHASKNARMTYCSLMEQAHIVSVLQMTFLEASDSTAYMIWNMMFEWGIFEVRALIR